MRSHTHTPNALSQTTTKSEGDREWARTEQKRKIKNTERRRKIKTIEESCQTSISLNCSKKAIKYTHLLPPSSGQHHRHQCRCGTTTCIRGQIFKHLPAILLLQQWLWVTNTYETRFYHVQCSFEAFGVFFSSRICVRLCSTSFRLCVGQEQTSEFIWRIFTLYVVRLPAYIVALFVVKSYVCNGGSTTILLPSSLCWVDACRVWYEKCQRHVCFGRTLDFGFGCMHTKKKEKKL